MVSRFARYRKELRKEFLTAYGHECSCCGETEEAFLTLEHKRNNGAQHKRLLNSRSSTVTYLALKRQGWPKDDFTLLCYNCNCASWKLGYCPHRGPDGKVDNVA